MNRIARLTRVVLVVGVVVSLMSCGNDDSSPTGPTQLAPTAPTTSGSVPATSAPLSVSVAWQVFAPASVVAGDNQQSYRFTAKVVGGAAPYTYRWNFRDGTSPVEGNPVTHKFYRPGKYAVAVTVRDAAGNVARSDTTEALEIEVVASPFSLACHVGPITGEAPLEVELRAEPTGNVGPIRWSWDFGDGEGASQRITSHVYDPPGNNGRLWYTATANAIDGLGRSVQCSQQIVVSIPNRCLHDWVSACASQGVSAVAIDEHGCRSTVDPPSFSLPASLAAACIYNRTSKTQTVGFTYAGGSGGTFAVFPASHQCVLMICPALGTSADGPMTLSW